MIWGPPKQDSKKRQMINTVGEDDKIVPALVSRQCPVVFLVEVHLKQGKALGIGEGKGLGRGKNSG
jgi:hypothetical protein